MLVFDSGGNDFSNLFRANDVDLDALHDEIKLNNEVLSFRQPALERYKSWSQNNWGLSFPFACKQSSFDFKSNI